MVAFAELFADVGVRQLQHVAHQIHRDLAGFYHLLLPAPVGDICSRNLEEVGVDFIIAAHW